MFKNSTLKTGTILITLVSTNVAWGSTPQQQQPESVQPIESDIKKRVAISGVSQPNVSIEKRMVQLNVAGASIAVINDGKLAWAKGYGLANAKTQAEVNQNTLFQAGSISKPVAALAALKLVEQGKIGLDDDVNKYLKDWQLNGEKLSSDDPVTLRQLLTHTAGLTVHGFPGYATGSELPTTIGVLSGQGNTDKVEVAETPGSEWRYSGGGYTVMQKLVEDISGVSFAQFTDAHILKPMGMENSTYQHDLPAKLKAHASGAFDRDGEMFQPLYNDYPEKAAAGLWTTPTDIAKYVLHMQAILKGKPDAILKKQTVENMFTPHKNDWGLGPRMFKINEQWLFGHGGKNLGFTNDFRAYVEKGEGYIIMTNSDSGGDLISELRVTISEYYGFDIAQQKTIAPHPMSEADLKRFEGNYKMVTDIGWVGDFIMEIQVTNGQLMIDDPFVSAPQRIVAVSAMDFVNAHTSSDFVFSEDEEQNITGLKIRDRFELERL